MRIASAFALPFLALCLTAEVGAAPIYVDLNAPGPGHDGLTWDTAFLTIQEGVDAATPGGEVWVADGTYVENVVMGEGVATYGGFLGAEPGGYETQREQRDFVNNVATIDGNQSGSCVVMAVDARVDGFTVTNGAGTVHEEYPRGGGIYCEDVGTTGVIANNILTGNTIPDPGGKRTHRWGFCRAAASKGADARCNRQTDRWVHGRDGWAPTAVPPNSTGVPDYICGGGISCDNSSPLVANNVITGNCVWGGGGGIWCGNSSSATITGNTIADNEAYGGGGVCCDNSSPLVTGNTIAGNLSDAGGGVYCSGGSPILTNNTIACNLSYGRGGGIECEYSSSPVLTSNTITDNSAPYEQGGGIYCSEDSSPQLSHNDIWGNNPDDYFGCEPGEGDISEDPLFVNPDVGDFHLTGDSPCVDAGDNSAPGLPEADWEGEDRIVNGVVDMGADEYVTHYSAAPDPQPGCGGALFGGSQAGFPAWVWFSVPLTPDCVVGSGCADPNTLLGFDCKGKLFYWDKYGKFQQVYQPPFVTWDLAVGNSYILRLTDPVANPAYDGLSPFVPATFEFLMGRQGWTWVGMPGLTELTGGDFMASVTVQYPSDDTGGMRTAQQDYDATPDNWITWGWPFYDTYLQAPKTFTPYAPFGNRTCYPWIGYRCWVKVGTAQTEDDPDQVTLIWPQSQ